MSPFESLFSAAIAGLTSIALSQVILVRGFGNSCSQATLAKRPSQTQESGLNTMCNGSACGEFSESRPGGLADNVNGRAAVSATKPSCRARVHRSSNTEPNLACQVV